MNAEKKLDIASMNESGNESGRVFNYNNVSASLPLKPFRFNHINSKAELESKNSHQSLSSLPALPTVNDKDSSRQKDIIGKSPKFLAAIHLAERIAPSAANVLLYGESGTGKEVFANFIHKKSKQNKGSFIAINCSSIPADLLESELFGHAKGSFTGASEKRIGLFEAAENGTLFLDEIGDLGLPLQAKILRVLQEKRIRRVGENQDKPINCRIISATHKNLLVEVRENRFREDLFFRLNVIPISLPPLRERQEDILLLAEAFLKKFTLANQSKAKIFSPAATQYLLENQWRGNVRELENTIERAIVLCEGSEVSIEDVMPIGAFDFKANSESPEGYGTYQISGAFHSNLNDIENTNLNGNENGLGKYEFSIKHFNHLPSLDEVINKYISYAILKNSGAKDKTAKEIGIDRKTLYKRMLKSAEFS